MYINDKKPLYFEIMQRHAGICKKNVVIIIGDKFARTPKWILKMLLGY